MVLDTWRDLKRLGQLHMELKNLHLLLNVVAHAYDEGTMDANFCPKLMERKDKMALGNQDGTYEAGGCRMSDMAHTSLDNPTQGGSNAGKTSRFPMISCYLATSTMLPLLTVPWSELENSKVYATPPSTIVTLACGDYYHVGVATVGRLG